MNPDDDQKLWDLLGRTAEPKVSPFFSRNVLREIRQLQARSPLSEWFGLRRLVPAAGVVVALIAAVVLVRTQTAVPPSSESQSDKVVSAQEYEVIADLDDLLASDENLDENDAVLL